MKVKFWLIGLVWVWMLAGCASTHLVQHSTAKTDSTQIESYRESTINDSSFYKEEKQAKTIEGSSVESAYSKTELDSLFAGLRTLPSVSRTIYKTDPKIQTTLAIVLDSLGKIHFKCITAERAYYETSIRQGRYMESARKEIIEKDRTIKLLELQIKQQEDSWITKLGRFLNNGFWLIVAIGALVIGFIIFKKL